MKTLLFPPFLVLISLQSFSQDFSDLRYYEAGNINLFYSHETEDNPLFLGVLTNDANRFYSKTLGEKELKVNLLVLNKDDWGIYTSKQLIYGMPHWRRTDNAIIVSSDDNFFWAAHLPNPNTLQSPDKELFEETYGTENGGMSARFFFDLGTIHELFHLWLFNGQRESQRIWLEEIFCNLAAFAYTQTERPEWVSGLKVLADYQVANDKAPHQYRSLETFEENRMKIVMEAPQNYGWYQFRFIQAASQLYDEAGVEVMKKLWDFLGEYQEKLFEDELKNKLTSEVHPYFKVLMEEW
ncbi:MULTISPECIES: hypothetical protein [Cyclobacteriaceae]|uniref:Peptidase M1 membrane alanine aminopeptidase domain-containing protein n=2 Tax=Cyclobacteriaceae TaxID=563798 RepID=A0A239CQ87_9BACT|nr:MULTISPECIES: hypothetical protein [Cyclobacteriaceae]PRY87401.1 hypothetical protein CLW00_10620 [Mongoliibacter ruber]SNS22267.1 hypothetical protein SAMN06295967_105172 [Belliella buryatensis]